MKKPAITPAHYALVVDKSRIDTGSCRGEYGTWQFRFVDISKGIDALDYPDKWDATGRLFKDLTVRVQWSREDNVTLRTYAWQFYFDDARVEDVQTAESHLAMMKRIDKARQSMVISPNTFGQFLTLMCLGIGVKTFLTKGERKDNPGWRSLADHYYIGHTVDNYLATLVDHEIARHYYPKPEAMSA
jgi:hypothetical protein